MRYGQILQADGDLSEDPGDAQYLTIGLDFGFGSSPDEEDVAPEAVVCPEVIECVQNEPVQTSCPDRDSDDVCDADDRCPTRFGPAATLGCPVDPCTGVPLVVLVQFEQDSSALPTPTGTSEQTMDPVLDEVAEAIAQDPSCRVCIIGHTSDEGTPEYNQELSQRRATAVQGYLSARGLDPSHMPSVGMGESCQLEPATSRMLNRRVEFYRLGEGESCPAECIE